MKTLTSVQWYGAAEWLQRHGRPLDRALFANVFQRGSAEAVLHELAAYQNPDGGFGHGLEADIRTPASTVIATTQAFELLRRLNTPADRPLVQRDWQGRRIVERLATLAAYGRVEFSPAYQSATLPSVG